MPRDYQVAELTPAYQSRIVMHFVNRCHQRGVDMTYELADKLNDIARKLNRIPKATSKVMKLYRTPAWSTKIYQVQSNGEFFYMIFDTRKDGFVTIITQAQMDERDSKTCSLHSRNKNKG